MRRTLNVAVVRKQSGKVTLSTNVINGMTPKTTLKLADTIYYQVGPAGDYVQESGY